jgi:hypothetical protein
MFYYEPSILLTCTVNIYLFHTKYEAMIEPDFAIFLNPGILGLTFSNPKILGFKIGPGMYIINYSAISTLAFMQDFLHFPCFRTSASTLAWLTTDFTMFSVAKFQGIKYAHHNVHFDNFL